MDKGSGSIAAQLHSLAKLDDVRIYNIGLTAQDVSDLYNFGTGDLAKVGGFTTLPNEINATVGSAVSSTVTANVSNPSYVAYNLPAGLSINSASGEISGTPTVGGSHAISVRVIGGDGKLAVATINYSAGTSAPVFGTPGAANVLQDGAILLGEIAQSGSDSNYTVDIVWDTSDKGTSNLSDWNGSATAVGTGKEGFYGKEITGLSLGTTYYYRLRTTASDSSVAWSGAQNFTTATSTSAPTLGSQSVSDLTANSAIIKADLTSNGNAATEVVLFWGDDDAGTTAASWDSNFTISNAQAGLVQGSIPSGLTSGTTYYFRARATNYKGTVWASTTRAFTTVTSTVRAVSYTHLTLPTNREV